MFCMAEVIAREISVREAALSMCSPFLSSGILNPWVLQMQSMMKIRLVSIAFFV